MNLSPEFLNRASAETGFSQSTLEKAIRLGDLATNISRHPLLGNVLALKGGTALNLCFGPPKRLSVDLDFNYIGHADRDAMLAHRPEAHEAVLQLVGRMGYQTQESSKGFAGGKIFLGYRSASGNRDRIELDLNYLYRIPWSGTSTRLLWQPDGLDPALIRVVGLPELLIGKLLAFLDRMAARDVWDVANLPAGANEALALPSFRKELIAFSAILVHPLGSYTREGIGSTGLLPESSSMDILFTGGCSPSVSLSEPRSANRLSELSASSAILRARAGSIRVNPFSAAH